ncbi:MAG: GAF domain-containing protein [Pseudomonadota bacterium]
MGFAHTRVKRRYDLTELGLLEGPPLKASKIVTEAAWESLKSTSVVFFVFDDTCGEILVHAAAHQIKLGNRYPIYTSALPELREDLVTVNVPNLKISYADSIEAKVLKMAAMLAAPVLGPDMSPIGALVAFDRNARDWTEQERERLENFAYLVTQEIILRASFATIEIMSANTNH